MKITREQLHHFIDSQPKEMSVDEIIIALVCSYIMRRPIMIPSFIEQISNTLSMITEKLISSMHVFNERAWYLETYLDGKMYTEEYNNTEEAKEIQKAHATFIREKSNNILGGRWYE